MASAAEQLAANMNLGVFSKATELKKRIWFTLLALVVYRLGTYIPVPGIDPNVLRDIFRRSGGGGILGMFDMFSGGALQRMTIFALNIMPYISASIIIQLLTSMIPSFDALKKEGEQGRKKLNQYTRYATVVIAAFQAYGIAAGLEGMNTGSSGAVFDPGFFFRATTVITLVGGTMFLMWLGEQITARGVGNGTSLIIFAGIVANLPRSLASTLEMGRTGAMSAPLIIFILFLVVAMVTTIVYVERAQRRIIVQYPKRQVGNKMYGGEASHLPLKLNTSGVIPPIFASSILLMPITVAGFAAGRGPEWLQTLVAYARPRPAALSRPLCRADRFLRLLLHRRGLQSGRYGGQSEEVWRLPARHPSRQEHRGLSRLRADPPHRVGRHLSGGSLHRSRDPDQPSLRAVLYRRHQPVDRCHRYNGYCGADTVALARPSI